MTEFKQYALIYFNYNDMSDVDCKHYPFKPHEDGGLYVYLGEIPQMPGHIIVADYYNGRLYCGYHAEDFIEISERDM